MRLRNLLLGFMAISASLLIGCTSDKMPDTTSENDFVEVPKCNGTVSVRTLTPTRASSSVDATIDNLTATRCDTENISGHKYYLVSYHGRNKAQIGMVQVLNPNTYEVIDELYFDDARVNYVQSCSNGAVYIGVDRKGNKDMLCGIVAVKINSQGRFVLPNGAESAQIQPYKVNGLSVNCMKLANNNALVVASAGNEGLDKLGEEYSKAGFTKFETKSGDPTVLSVKVDETKLNYRGYWVSYNAYTNCSNFTYRTVEGNDLVYYLGVTNTDKVYRNNNILFNNNQDIALTEVYRQSGNTNSYERYGSCTYEAGGKIYVIASTGTKEGGARVFLYDKVAKTLTLTDVWHKACRMTSTRVLLDGKTYTYAACSSGGLYKVEVTADGKLIPVSKYVSPELTESGTVSSINYVQEMDGKLHVCEGYAGFKVFDFNDARFVPCEERTDFSLE